MALSKIDVANMLTGLVPNDNTIRRPNAKPLIINGDMQIAQRGTSFTHANSNNNEFPVDRFQFVLGSIGEYTSTQESLSSGAAYNAGFKKAARIDTTSAVSSPDAGDYFWFQYIMEAQDCLVFKKGTSSAEKMTVAFWVKSNKTGTGQLTVKDSDNDRQVAGTYTISSADTWEHKVINLPADTSGAMNNDNGAGFRFEWWLGAGSSYSGGAVPTAWEARADGDRGVSTLAINDNTANDWAITGIQVEVGEFTSATLPPFQFEDTGDNLARCQRYLQLVAEGNSITVGAAGMYTASNMNCIVDLKAVMRTTPSVDQVSGTDYFSFQRDGANDTFNTLTIADSSDRAVRLYNNGQISGTQGDFGVVITNNSSTKLRLDAEL
ncbi:hypothetical protein OA003_00140 [bacterium]|nr:hypothetical protein [bacterium]